jgi:hypothetical protein
MESSKAQVVEGSTTTADDSSLNSSTASLDLDEDTVSEEEIKKAEEFKTKGNEAFKCNLSSPFQLLFYAKPNK